MRLHYAATALVALALLGGCAALAGRFLKPDTGTDIATLAPGDFTLDQRHAALLFRINHLGFADYVGRFERFDARLSGNPDDPANASVEAIVDMTSLDIADDAFAAELTGPDWLDATRHPQAVFRSRSVRLTGATTADVAGDLTLRGVTQPVVFAVTFNGTAFDPLRGRDVAGFSATATLDRSLFGIDRYAGLITQDVRLEIEAEFVRSSGG